MKPIHAALLSAAFAAPAMAQTVVSNYDNLAEAFYGSEFTYDGVTYSQVNNVNGVFPSGDPFEAGGGVEGLGDTIIVENATVLYNDFPEWGSANNVLTFGGAYVVGDNLSLGALSTVTMTLDQVADFASFEMAYYELGPWSGIQFNFEAMMGGSVVASDSFTIAGTDPGERDRIAFATMTVSGAEFDSMRIYATFGADYSGPRFIMDDLTINYVPAPGSLALLGLSGLLVRRRR